MPRILLFHWKESEIAERLELLRQAGYEGYSLEEQGPALMKKLRQEQPDAYLIDLSRLPSHGREVGAQLRSQKATRLIPLLFVGGDEDKVERVRDVLPDAVFTTWEGISQALARALANPLREVVRLQSSMDAYSGQPLSKKLGIKAGTAVALFDSPAGFIESLGPLPDGVSLVSGRVKDLPLQPVSEGAVGIWFVQTQADLLSGIDTLLHQEYLRSLWIAWPKKGTLIVSDLAQPVVRRNGLERGWVDYKVCAIDATWTALLFTRRKNPLSLPY